MFLQWRHFDKNIEKEKVVEEKIERKQSEKAISGGCGRKKSPVGRLRVDRGKHVVGRGSTAGSKGPRGNARVTLRLAPESKGRSKVARRSG